MPPPRHLDPSEVVARFTGLVWALCRRMDPDPEDAAQDLWAHLLDRLHRYDPDRGSPRSFVLAVCHRRLVDRHRRRAVRRTLPFTEIADDSDTEALVEKQRRSERLEQALLRLPPGQRRVVVAHHIHGRPLDRIAHDEGVAIGTVKSRLHRGRARLAELLRRYR